MFSTSTASLQTDYRIVLQYLLWLGRPRQFSLNARVSSNGRVFVRLSLDGIVVRLGPQPCSQTVVWVAYG